MHTKAESGLMVGLMFGYRKWFKLVLVLVMVVTIIPVGSVKASGTLDQQQTEDDGPVNTLGGQSLGQTFTAGLTGSLTEVDIVVGCLSFACGSSTVTVQIFSGSPPGTGVLLAQTSLSGSSVKALVPGPGAPFTTFTFTAPAPVAAGKKYSIILTSNAGGFTFAVGGSASKVYSGGESYHNAGGGWVADTLTGLDWAFETFVTPPYSICVIQLGVQQPNGTVSSLPGYGYPDIPISRCQNETEVLGQDILGRTIVLHQYIENMTDEMTTTRFTAFP